MSGTSDARGARGDFELGIKIGGAEFSAAGTSEFVMDAFSQFRTLLETRSVPWASSHLPQAPTESGPREPNDEKIPLPIFMKRNWPNQAAKAAAIFTWAKRYDARDKLKPGEMSTYWKKVDKKPGNPTMACQGAEGKGWLESVGSGYYSLLGHGENMVDDTPYPGTH